jgi:small subunit ribosomal protein S1
MAEEKSTPAAEEQQAAPVAQVETTQNTQEFLDNFNWDKYQEGIERVDESKLEEFEKLVSENFVDTADEDVVVGTVVYLTDREAIIDINAKSEGVISLNEFRYNPDLKVGDKVEVLIDIREDKTGQLVLSHRKARTIKAWGMHHDKFALSRSDCTAAAGWWRRIGAFRAATIFGCSVFLPPR